MSDQPTKPASISALVPAAAPAPPPRPTPGGPKPIIAFDDFAKLDLRVARIVQAEYHPKADKLLKLQLDDGSGTTRQICAGIREAYKPEELVGRLIVIVANLAPRNLRGEESRGMLLAASDAPREAGAADPAAVRRVVLL
ncbi:MAG: methionine--tRNA ligase subunit beta, partial [Thermoleophilia bacterium]|nr:methionine--tRNA ligase subunit beta [Beijerinckiaceae bacterium]MBY0397017.1 methionine--tRNA ligase subunit beta [Thermoleophilia bacterium]